MTGLLVSGVSKTFGSGRSRTPALVDVSMSVSPGEIVALVGNNGAGKTTLMSIVAGLIPADTGTVTVLGEETTAAGGTPSHNLGLAPQEEALYPTLTARRNLRYFGELAGLKGDALEQRVDEVSGQLLIGDLLDRKARELSGGQRRRLHTGLALMHRPAVLLLDEPTVGVDMDARIELLDFVRRSAEQGAAILYSTHQLGEVEQIASRAIVLDHGRVLAGGSVTDIVEQYSAPMAELRLADGVSLQPSDIDGRVDRVTRTVDGDSVVFVGLGPGVTQVAQVLEGMSPGARAEVVGAVIHQPSFEQAYLNLTRRARSESSGCPESNAGGSGHRG